MKAAPHQLETARLKALREYRILDTPRESEFDEIVALASKICDAPISVINLIDADRQWFKAEVGLDTRETPLATSICAHIILQDDFVEIPDTLRDPRMKDNPLCLADPGLRFYAGALLKTHDNLPIGTLCILDDTPRTLTALQKETLRVLASQVMKQLDFRVAIRRQAILNREMDHRVKNSLQTVSSLIRLKMSDVSSKEAKEVLETISNRIQSIALLHQELQQSGSNEKIDLSRYMANIGKFMHDTEANNISVKIAFDDIQIDSGSASSIAMIINEFGANSSKHAFPDGLGGVIKIEGKIVDEKFFDVHCTDDGIGMPAKTENKGGLGMKIISASIKKLGAEIIEKTDGTGAHLSFRIPRENLES